MRGRARLVGTGIFVGRNAFVHRVAHNAFGSHLVERLHVDQTLDEAFLVEFHHVGRDATEGKRRLDAAVDHFFADVFHGSQRSTARTRLNRESIAEITAVHDDFRSLLGEQNVTRVLRVANRTRRNLRRVADAIDFDHEIDIVLGNGIRHIGIGHEVVGQNHHLVGILGIGLGIAERATDRLGVLRARITGCVTRRVARRCAEESHVDVQVAVADGRATTAVRTEHNGFLHQTVRNLVGEFAAQSAGRNFRHHAVFDVLDERFVNVLQARSGHVQVFETHFGQFIDHHVHHFVATAEVVVERNRHAVFQSAATDGFFQRAKFRFVLLKVCARSDVLAAFVLLIDGLGHF